MKFSRKQKMMVGFTLTHDTVDKLDDLKKTTLINKSALLELMINDVTVKQIKKLVTKKNRPLKIKSVVPVRKNLLTPVK